MNLRVYLATMNMHVKDFGELLEYNPCYISSIVSGRCRPSERLAKAIERATGGMVSAEELNPMKKEPKKSKGTTTLQARIE